MKFSRPSPELDSTDRGILELLQENCKQPLAAIGERVGLSAPAVVDRIHKLEEAGIITREDADLVAEAEAAREEAVQVDSFTLEEFMRMSFRMGERGRAGRQTPQPA